MSFYCVKQTERTLLRRSPIKVHRVEVLINQTFVNQRENRIKILLDYEYIRLAIDHFTIITIFGRIALRFL